MHRRRRRLLQPARRRAGEDRASRYDDLKHLNPAIVCCSLSGFGMTGPRRKEPGYDYILQGLAGWMDVTGEPDGPPDEVRPVDGRLLRRVRRGDLAAGRRSMPPAATASAWTVTCRSTTPRSAMLTYPATWHLNAGFVPAADPALRAPVAGAVPGVPDEGRLDHRGLREGEVLAATGPGRRDTRNGQPIASTRRSRRGVRTGWNCSPSWRRSS